MLDKKKHGSHLTIKSRKVGSVMSYTSCGGVSAIPVEHAFLEILEYISLAVSP